MEKDYCFSPKIRTLYVKRFVYQSISSRNFLMALLKLFSLELCLLSALKRTIHCYISIYYSFFYSQLNNFADHFRKLNKERENPTLMKNVTKWSPTDEEIRKNLPPGVKLVNTLRGHVGAIGRIAWSPDGQVLASPSEDRTIRLWNVNTGDCFLKLEGHKESVLCVAFDPVGHKLASGGYRDAVKLWDSKTGKLIREFSTGSLSSIYSVAFDPKGRILACGDELGYVQLWYAETDFLLANIDACDNTAVAVTFDQEGKKLAAGSINSVSQWEMPSSIIKYSFNTKLIHKFEDNNIVFSLAIDNQNNTLVTGGDAQVVKLWDWGSGILLRLLEGHTEPIKCVAFLGDGRLLVSMDDNGECRFWSRDTGACLGIIPSRSASVFGLKPKAFRLPGLAFNPHFSYLAVVGLDSNSSMDEEHHVIRIYELDITVLLNQQSMESTVTYTSEKIVLVGDSGVGKTGLGWRLTHGEFKEHSSSHGQQFWLLNQLYKQRGDGAQCEVVLWDLAGQPDYRLINSLFLDDVDLALLLFDPARDDDSLSGVEFWLKQLKVEVKPPSGTPTVLIAARSDRGTPRLTQKELDAFCQQRGIRAYLLTSAKSGEGIEELIQQMRNMIPWDSKPATVTTETFKRIKDFVLCLKENNRHRKVILTPKELRQRLEKTDHDWKFSDAQMMTAVGHLENHGYVKKLKTSIGEIHILLAPEMLNNLAASFVLEARRNQEGLGSLEEQRLLLGKYKFPELEKLSKVEQDILLDSVAVLFLEHNVCFRETNPLNNLAYLVFPELINMKKPLVADDIQVEDDIAYTVNGAIENVYASLVVLMGYTQTFTRTNHWQNHARYEMAVGYVCGFRLEGERAGALDFVLYFGVNTPTSVKMLFQGLFENFLARRNLTVHRIEPVLCSKRHILNRAVVREHMLSGEEYAFCSRCGERIWLPKADQPIYLTQEQVEEVEANRREADKRTRFEQVLFLLKSYVTEHEINSLECFISYAWGDSDHELWVERKLATDLQKAGIIVILDRWENVRIGASIPRFVERVGKSDRVIVVGTRLYQKKYENNEPLSSFVVAAEGDLIGKRMIGTETEKESVMPILLEGSDKLSFPLILQGRVYADFRKNEGYFNEMLKLLLSIYDISLSHPIAVELNELLSRNKEFKSSHANRKRKVTF